MQMGVILAKNVSATGNGTSVPFPGGRSVLVVMGTLATTSKLQMLGPDESTWLDVATISASGPTSYDLPPGNYRFNLSGGSPSGVYAYLNKISYV